MFLSLPQTEMSMNSSVIVSDVIFSLMRIILCKSMHIVKNSGAQQVGGGVVGGDVVECVEVVGTWFKPHAGFLFFWFSNK